VSEERSVPWWIALVSAIAGGLIAVAGSYVVAQFQADQTANEHIRDRRTAAYAVMAQSLNRLQADYMANGVVLGVFVDTDKSTTDRDRLLERARSALGASTPAEAVKLLVADVAALSNARAGIEVVGTPRAAESAFRLETKATALLLYIEGLQAAFATEAPGTLPSSEHTLLNRFRSGAKAALNETLASYRDFLAVAQLDTSG
jgi:hypothetical protein